MTNKPKNYDVHYATLHNLSDHIKNGNMSSWRASLGPLDWRVRVPEGSINEPSASLGAEKDPTGLAPTAPGAKLDAAKVDVLRGAVQYFPRALTAVARVSELGAQKYSWKGWESVPNGRQRYGAALCRHLLVDNDFATDTGPGGLGSEVLHATQVAWNALARLELILKERNENKSNS